MAVEIRRAETGDDLNQVFALRAETFIGEGVLDHGSSDLLFDEFDAYPETVNFVALKDGRVVGACRGSLPSPFGMPADQYFDFRPHVPDAGRTTGSGSMLCVDSSHRDAFLGLSLVRFVMYWMQRQGATHACAPVRPEAAPIMKRMGWTQVGEVFDHAVERVPVVPMVVDFGDAADSFARVAGSADTHGLVEDFRRRVYAADETIVTTGDTASEVFVLVEGAADVLVGGTRVAELAPGDVFGEVGVLLNRERTADVVARGRTEAMVLNRHAFEAQLVREPAGALRLLRLMGDRLVSADS